MGRKYTITASDGFTLNAYRAEPEGAPRGGVVVIQEIWGINSWVRSVADRFARHGYLAIAPAMFDRLEFGYESEDYSAAQFAVIRQMLPRFDHETGLLDVAAAVSEASAGGKVGITGYCFGGAVTWRAASAGLGLTAGSGYYGGGVPSYIDLVPKVPLEMHYADKDTGIPLEQIEQLKARHPEVDIYLYDGTHGFCNSDRPAKFSEEACTKASARTLAFFHKHLG